MSITTLATIQQSKNWKEELVRLVTGKEMGGWTCTITGNQENGFMLTSSMYSFDYPINEELLQPKTIQEIKCKISNYFIQKRIEQIKNSQYKNQIEEFETSEKELKIKIESDKIQKRTTVLGDNYLNEYTLTNREEFINKFQEKNGKLEIKKFIDISEMEDNLAYFGYEGDFNSNRSNRSQKKDSNEVRELKNRIIDEQNEKAEKIRMAKKFRYICEFLELTIVEVQQDFYANKYKEIGGIFCDKIEKIEGYKTKEFWIKK